MIVLKDLTKSRKRDDVVKRKNSRNRSGHMDEKVEAAGIKSLQVLISLCRLQLDLDHC